MTIPVLDVVIPVHNEDATLATSVHQLHGHLVHTFPYPFRLTVADNASTDATWQEARRLQAAVPEVVAVHLDEKGRGRALKQVWLASDAPILAYMDVDLSTDLDALWPLLAPLMSGHSDLAIGSRLRHGSRVVRGAKREVISRSYNLLLRVGLGARFSDAQCGFKAIRADVAHELLPLVEDPTWFFDTEMLVLAERSALRIHEVPVDWYDDPDSRVDIVGTALDDLKGMRRLRRSLTRGELPVADIAGRIGRHASADGGIVGQVGRFAWVGLLSTAVHLGLFAALRSDMDSAQVANLSALLIATLFNTWANRRWTFGVRGPRRLIRHQAQGLAIFGLTWAMTAASLALAHVVASAPPTWVETAVVGAATLTAATAKFLMMRRWRPEPAPAAATAPVVEGARRDSCPEDAEALTPMSA